MASHNTQDDHVVESVKEKEAPTTGIPLVEVARPRHQWSSNDREQWSSGICDCFDDVGGCFDAWCCSSCLLSKQYNATLYGKMNTMHWPLCLSIVCCDGLTKGATAIITRGFPLYFIRKELRDRYHLSNYAGSVGEDGTVVYDEPCDMWTDVMLVLCCTPCVMCQHQREMTARGEWPGKILFGSDPTRHMLDAPTSATAV